MREMRLGIAVVVTRAYCCSWGNVMCRLCQMDDVDKCCGFGIGKAWEMSKLNRFGISQGLRGKTAYVLGVLESVCGFLADRDYV